MTNQLNHVRDQVASTAYTVDIDNQSANNYTYDAIGNLLTDAQERVTGTTWNVYGKIVDVTRSFASHKTASTRFQYDPSGNRLGKVISTFYEGDRKYWYIRDAQGNVMAVYYSETNPDWSNGPVRLQEHHLYGSSRLGLVKKDFDISQSKATAVNANLVGPTYLYTTVRGSKAYELTNHLGNVLATISDRRVGHVNGSNYDYYEAEVLTATDNYPFGMIQPGRNYNGPGAADYRYGFNGKENDDEAKGEGNQQDYGMRVYDPRIGRFFSVVPIAKNYPWNSTYGFAENDVIRSIDLDGLEKIFVLYNPFSRTPVVICLGCKIKEAADDYMGGITQKAMVENQQMPYHNKDVPNTVQDRLDNINTSEANAKIAKGISQTTSINVQNSFDVITTIMPLGEGVSLGAKGLSNVVKVSSKAKSFATKFADDLIKATPKDELPRAITAILDTKTGKVYYGRSGVLKNTSELNAELKNLLPKESLEKWPVANCAECDSLNNALNSGADIKNLEMHTLKIDKKTGQFSDFERCSNCKLTTKDIKTTSDKKNRK